MEVFKLNIGAVLVSGAAYWIIGSLWFSVVVGKLWQAEIEKQGIVIKEPTKGQVVAKMLTTLLYNIMVAAGAGMVVAAAHSETLLSGLTLGIVLGICFPFAMLGIAYIWESRSFKLLLADAGYAMIGITVCCIIQSLWK